MTAHLGKIHYLIGLIAIFAIFSFEGVSGEDVASIPAYKIVKARGYRHEIHPIETQAGYILNLVRIINPKIPKPTRHPIVFVHGIGTSSTCFIINSKGGKPRNLGHLHPPKMSRRSLEKLLLKDPAARSLPFLMSNFGHEVWLMNRRASIESQFITPAEKEFMGPINRTESKEKHFREEIDDDKSKDDDDKRSRRRRKLEAVRSLLSDLIKRSIRGQEFDEKYWNFTMDEQIEYDFPVVIDYILETTGWPKLSIVSHSLGGGLTLMFLIDKPEYSEKLFNAALLAPALHLGETYKQNPIIRLLVAMLPILTEYQGPLLPGLLEKGFQDLVSLSCELKMMKQTFCKSFMDVFLGDGTDQLIKGREFTANVLDTTGSRELAQAIHSASRGKMTHFDYRDLIKNDEVYGSIEPPYYNASKITADRLSFWSGNSDTLVTAAGADVIMDEMTVPVERHVIGGNGINFNHIAFFYHKNVTSLLTIPVFMSLQSGLGYDKEKANEDVKGERESEDEISKFQISSKGFKSHLLQ